MELPYGLKGLPEGYILSQEELADKQDMIDHDVSNTTGGLTAGADYEDGVLIFSADSQEEAELYAEAFSAELVDYGYGVAKIRLLTATVPQAVAAAQNMRLPLPAAYPNYIVSLEPIEVSPVETEKGTSAMSTDAPQRQNWNTWVNEVLTNPDPALLYPTDGYYTDRSWIWQPYQYMHDVVDSYAAWGVTTGKEVLVAVLDTGVNGTNGDHPDLFGKVVEDINVGYGYGDQNGHGTHVAGIIAATMNNGKGGAGIAPDARILSVRVLDADGSGSYDVIIRGIYAAANSGAKVINMSLGGTGYTPLMQEAVDYARERGVTVVAAMGNDGTNCVQYPAACDGVIAVVASNSNNSRATFSNYGSWADIAAPGAGIYSTTITKDGSDTYESWNGTSMATPVVAGIVALYKSVYPRATPAEIEARLKSTATKGGSDLGVGIANAANMLSEKPATPDFLVLDEKGDPIDDSAKASFSSTISCESKLKFYSHIGDKNEFILYTLDGKTPSVKNGAVVVGTKYESPIDLTPYAGKTITVKAVQVNGLGMAGKVLSKKVTITLQITGVTVSGPTRLIAGKTGEFTAVVEPADKANQSVTWSTTPDSMAGAKIDPKTGKLTTPKNVTGSVKVVATSTVSGIESQPFEVTVKQMNPVAKMTLSQTSVSLFIGKSTTLSVTMKDVVGSTVTPDVSWTSSNTKVATVDANGVVTAVAKGSATITCKALDGSGKSAKCSVKVMQAVTDITIAGQYSIAPGASATYKATVLPATADNKKVTWSLVGAPEGVTISSSGRVTVPKDTAPDAIFTVRAVSQDVGIVGTYTVYVAPKCASVSVWFKDETWPGWAPGPNAWNSATQKLTKVGLFNVDLKDSPAPDCIENKITLVASTLAKNGDLIDNDECIVWSSSNLAVASVDEKGNVTAHKAGSAKITAAAMDGSGKKATVTINVTVPVSTMALTSSAPKGTNGMSLLAAGKSFSHKVVFGDTYGKPSNQKVEWGWDVYYTVPQSDGSYQLVSMRDEFAGLISCSGGKLSVKSSAKNLIERYNDRGIQLWAEIYAYAKDGTDGFASHQYQLVSPATVLYYVRTVVNDDIYGADFYCDQAVVPYTEYDENDNIVGTYYISDFVVTSSNPKVVNILGVDSYGDGRHRVWFSPDKAGTAKLTIKTTDGSNKSCSITVKVY